MSEQNWKYVEIGVNTASGVLLLFSGHVIGMIAGCAALALAYVQSKKAGLF